MGMYKSNIKIGPNEHVVVSISHKEEQEQLVTTTVDKLHHIHILDRSGSMAYEIDGLIDSVQNTFNVIGEDDYVTIIWFSSKGMHRTLVKGATKSDKLISILDTIRSVIGATCFSEPLKEVNEIINELGDLAPISVTLFTDGQPVVPWSTEEEINRCVAEVTKMKGKILAFNTVGFGNYYNEEFLRSLSSITEYGTFVHSSRIDDYKNIFTRNFDKISEVVSESIAVYSEDNFLMYLNRNFTKLDYGTFVMSRINKRKNQVFIFSPTGTDFEFSYQGQKYNSADITTNMPPATIKNFLYGLAYNLYYEGSRAMSRDILVYNLKDKSIVDSHFSSFTKDECSNHLEALHSCIFNNSSRMIDGECSDDYVPAPDAKCVMDVLDILQNGNSYYIPFSENTEYRRIGRKAKEEISFFEKTKEEVRVPFSDLVFNESHMNVSVRICIPGKVKLNPKQAKKVGLPTEIESCIFRNHTIVKDGALNIEYFEILISDEDYDKLKDFDIIEDESLGMEYIDEKPYYRKLIDMSYLPIINQTYIKASGNIDVIFDSAFEIVKLKTAQKIINYYVDTVMEKSVLKKTGKLADYTVDQITVLEEHGLSKEMVYQGIDRKLTDKEDCDSYQSRTLDFAFAGFSSIPKVTDLLERLENGKKLTPSLEVMNEQYNIIVNTMIQKSLLLEKANAKLRDELLLMQKNVKQKLNHTRNELSTLKMAKLLTGDWFDNLQVDDKNNEYYEKNGRKMIVKADYLIEYF